MGNVCCQNTSEKQITSMKFQSDYQLIPEQPTLLNSKILAVKQKIQQLNQSELVSAVQQKNINMKVIMKNKKNGNVYCGTAFKKVPEGYGKLYLSNGQYFQGTFSQGAILGKGILIKPNGQYYKGEVENNKANGKGKLVSQDFQFEGIWKDSSPLTGTYKYKNGIEVNMRDGTAQIKWPNKDYYIGQVKNMNPHGVGKMTFHDLKSYEGQWDNGQMHGKGVYRWADGTRYEGQYKNGKKQGIGKFFYKTGKVYDGQWFKGKQHGTGRILFNGLVISEGQWANGHQVKGD